jgi:hypothetical protein
MEGNLNRSKCVSSLLFWHLVSDFTQENIIKGYTGVDTHSHEFILAREGTKTPYV